MQQRTGRLRGALSSLVALTMMLSLVPAPALAEEAFAGDVPEWAVDDGQEAGLSAQATPPSAYDLRNDGLVTPVKQQSPWGSCWAFGGIAAAESSILSAYGTTASDTKLDLSEKHLAYFAVVPVTASVSLEQAGEGIHVKDESGKGIYNNGGENIYVTTLFSQGVGPVTESDFPYRGVDAEGNSHLNTQEFELDPEGATRAELVKELGSAEAVDKYLAERASQKGKSVADVLQEIGQDVYDSYKRYPAYSEFEDWIIPEQGADGQSNRLLSSGEVLKDGNVLPEYWVAAEGNKKELNDASIAAMKQELLNGHGVSICYKADQAQPGQDASSKYINTEKWAQYTYDDNVERDHAVCIVGWDDNYDKANFSHEVYRTENGKIVKENGKPVVDPDETAKTTPDKNGAWIVKNSWGSETDVLTDDLGNPTGVGSYGMANSEGKQTGYFYLSYYDKSIAQPETMVFTASLGGNGSFYTLQHDYMPATTGFYVSNAMESVVSAANVFSIDEGDGDMLLRSVSTRTSETNMRVTFAVYLLGDDAANPTDGTMVYRTSRNFEYGGFHRLDLDQPITMAEGQRFSIVTTASVLDKSGARKYSVSANQGLSKAMADKDKNAVSYEVAVVNEGESFVYEGGEWYDWAELREALTLTDNDGNEYKYNDVYPIDNFSIKAYAEPAGNEWTRLAGDNRYDTMAAIVERGFAADDGAEFAVVASGDNFPDALVASAVAGSGQAPVILTSRVALSDQARGQLQRLGVGKVYIMGGTAAVAPEVEDAIRGMGIECERVAGETRQGTALAAMRLLAGASDTVVVATGEKFADALSVGPWSYACKSPIVLTEPDGTLTDEQVQAIRDAGFSKFVIVGGDAVVSAGVETQLADLEFRGRLGGPDRYDTSRLIGEFALANGLAATLPAVATGQNFPDALAGAALCGKNGSILVLVRDESLTGADLLAAHADEIDHGYVLGGPVAVSDACAAQVASHCHMVYAL